MNKNAILFAVAGLLLIGGIGYVAMQNRPKPSDTMINKGTESAKMEEDDDKDELIEGTEKDDKDDPEENAMAGKSIDVEVEASNFKFSKPEIRVKKGSKVKLTLKIAQGFHDWVVDEFNVKTKQLQTGGSETVEFVADKAGTFEYYCSVGQHRAQGMVGKLIVE